MEMEQDSSGLMHAGGGWAGGRCMTWHNHGSKRDYPQMFKKCLNIIFCSRNFFVVVENGEKI